MRETENLEKGLLIKEKAEKGRGYLLNINVSFSVYTEEMKRVGKIAAPMVAVNLSQYFLQVISVMMVAHLGELYLSSTAIAVSFCVVTGFSFLYGMSTAMETLGGQAFGAEEYHKLGIQTHTAMFCLILTCLPISFLWVNMGKLLISIGQYSQIAHESAKFATFLIPALFGFAMLQPLIKYFQVQSLIIPMLVSSCVLFCFHIIVCWALVLRFRMNNIGAALAIGMSYWLNVLLLACYMNYSSTCAKTRASLVLMELFKGIGQFFHLAIPSAFMVCLSTITTLYTIPDGLAAAVRFAISR